MNRTGSSRRASGDTDAVILSTAVAETSLTVPGVRVVIDSGRRRSQEVDPRTGLPALVTRAVSRAGADQRRGRCGREGPGVCYRMWSPTEDRLRPPADPPEITVADLSPLLLQTLAWGTSSPAELLWVDSPPATSLESARSLLIDLGALGEDGRLTALGDAMAGLGFHPRLGAIALAGLERGRAELAAELVSVLDAGRSHSAEVVDAVRELRAGRADATLERAHRQWRRRLRAPRSAANAAPGDPDGPDDLDKTVADLLLAGYSDRLARRRSGRAGVYHLRHGGEVELPPRARALGDAEWIVVLDLDARTGSGGPGRLHLGAAVSPERISQLLARAQDAGQVTEQREVRWDPESAAMVVTLTRRLDAVVLDQRRVRETDTDADSVIEAVAAVVSRRRTRGAVGVGGAVAAPTPDRVPRRDGRGTTTCAYRRRSRWR